jgi:hypothetical protein
MGLRDDLSEWTCRSNYATATCEISGHLKAMGRSNSHNDGGEGSDYAFLVAAAHRLAVSAVFPVVSEDFS